MSFTPSTRFQALLLPVPASLWEAESDYTEQEPRAGRITPDDAASTSTPHPTLVGSGLVVEGGALELRIQRGGFPLRGEASFVYRSAGAADWIGCDRPNMITDWQEIDDGAGAGDLSAPHLLGLSTGTVVCAFSNVVAGVGTAYARLYVGEAWGARISVGTGTVVGLLELPDGRILLATGQPTVSYGTVYNVYRSDDGGASWALHQKDARGYGLAYAAGLVRGPGFVSDDLGANFHDTDVPSLNTPEAIVRNGPGLFGAVLDGAAANSGVFVGPVDDQGMIGQDELFGSGEGSPLDAANVLALVAADNGELLLLGAQDGTGGDGVIWGSQDQGTSWKGLGRSSMASVVPIGRWWHPNSAAPIITAGHLGACWHRGRVIVAAKHDGGIRGDSIDMIALGGPSTVTLPNVSASDTPYSSVGWELTWIPWTTPDVLGWSVSGAGSESVTSAGLELASAIGQDRYYSRTPNGDPVEGLIVAADVACTLGGSVASLICGLLLRTADGGAGFEVEIRLSSAQLRVVDVVAGSTLATVDMDGTSYPLITAGARILCALADGQLSVWTCDRGADVRRWALVYQGSVSDDGGAGGTSNVVTWGHPGVALAQTESAWTQLHVAHNDYTGAGALASGQDEDEVRGFPFRGVLPTGHRITCEGGPLVPGARFTMARDAAYAASRGSLASETSARATWRSVDTTADQVIAWRTDDLGAAWAPAGEGLWLSGCNWRTGGLEYYDGSAWVPLTTLDLAGDLDALAFTRRGHTITVDTGTATGSRWIDRGELVGATVDFGGGILRRVVANTEGTWSTSLTGHRLPILTLADCDGSEPAGGVCAVVQTQALLALYNPGGLTRTGWRLTIDAQDTVDGDIRAKWLLGELLPFGLHPDDAGDREVSAPIEEVETADGTLHRRSLGPARRRFTLAWSDGLIERWPLYAASLGTAPVMNMTATSGAPGAVVLGSEGRNLQAIIDELDALASPVVLIRSLPAGPPDVQQLQARRHFAACMIEGPIVVQEVQGVKRDGNSEGEGKLSQVAAITLRELV